MPGETGFEEKYCLNISATYCFAITYVDVVLQKDRCGLACENKKHRRLPWETRDDVIAVPP